MKVLVTGATGFIGNKVVTELLKNNHQLIATSRNGQKAESFSWFNKVKYIPLNLSRFDNSINYFNYFDCPEVIIHLAWEGLPDYNALFHIEENLFHHYFFLKNLIINGAKNVTVAGTCFEYGLQEGELNEELPSMPVNSYAIAKDSLRKFLEQLQSHTSFSFKWARLFYMYGEGQNPNSLLAQLEKGLIEGEKEFNMSEGKQLRDYLPVEKMAEYIVKVALQNKVGGIINCCSGIPISVNQLVNNFLVERGQNIKLNKGVHPYPEHEPMNFWGNNTKLNGIVNKKP